MDRLADIFLPPVSNLPVRALLLPMAEIQLFGAPTIWIQV
jgi:hypothetical protein